MARFSKRTVLLLLAAFVVLSVALRYPLIDHERYQADSYFVHHLSQSIVDEGRALWTFNLLSYVGYYPFSYPSGSPFLVAQISQMTGLSVEVSILVLGVIVGMILCLGAFCLAREFLNSPGMVLFSTFLVVTGSRFVDTTCWVGSARGILVMIMLLSIVAAFRGSNLRNNWLVLIAVFLGIGSASFHHMALLYFFFAFALVMSAFVSGVFKKRVSFNRRRLTGVVYIVMAVALSVVSFGYIAVFGRAVNESFTETYLFDLDHTGVSIVLNMAASYTNQIGFILPFAVLGIPYFIRYAAVNPKAMFPMATLVSFVPLLGLSLYVSMLIGPFIAMMGVFYLWKFLGSKRRVVRHMAVSMMVFLVLSSIVLPTWSMDRWNDRTYITGDVVEISSEAISDASYLRYSLSDGAYVISNSIVYTSLMVSVTNAPALSSGVTAVLAGEIDTDDMRGNVTLDINEFPPDIYRLLRYESGVNIDAQVYSIMLQGVLFSVSPSSQFFDSHSRLIVLVDNEWPSSLVTPYFTGVAKLPKELEDAACMNPYSRSIDALSSYEVYQSDRVSLYYVALPTWGSQ